MSLSRVKADGSLRERERKREIKTASEKFRCLSLQIKGTLREITTNAHACMCVRLHCVKFCAGVNVNVLSGKDYEATLGIYQLAVNELY